MSRKHLRFLKSDYAVPRNEFQPSKQGMTVYCAETGKIYRCESVSDERPREYTLYIPNLLITVRKEKLLYFTNYGELMSQSSAILNGQRSCAHLSLSPAEWDGAFRAYQRWKDDPVRSLTWPITEPLGDKFFQITKECSDQGVALHSRVTKQFLVEPHGEVLPGAPDQARAQELFRVFNNGGKHVEPRETHLVTAGMTSWGSLKRGTASSPVVNGQVNVNKACEKPLWVKAPDRDKMTRATQKKHLERDLG